MSRVWLQTGDASGQSMASAFGASHVVGTAVHQSKVAAVGNFDSDDHPDIIIGNRLFTSSVVDVAAGIRDVKDRFSYRAGIQIGPRDFEQVYAGDVNGDDLDDVVAVYDDGSFEIFLTIYDRANSYLDASGGVGFHSMGLQTLLVGHRITTVNFIGTLFGVWHELPWCKLGLHIECTACRLCRHRGHRRLRVGLARRGHLSATTTPRPTEGHHHRPRPRAFHAIRHRHTFACFPATAARSQTTAR